MSQEKNGGIQDPVKHLLGKRTISLLGPITEESVKQIIPQLLYLESVNPDEDIVLYVYSAGGQTSACFAIYDVIQQVKPDVSTICVGWALSCGAILLAAGAKGKRLMHANAQVMIHQPRYNYGDSRRTISEAGVDYEQSLGVKERFVSLLSKHTQQKEKVVRKDIEKDFWMSAKEAKKYGIVDKIIG